MKTIYINDKEFELVPVYVSTSDPDRMYLEPHPARVVVGYMIKGYVGPKREPLNSPAEPKQKEGDSE